MIDGPVSDTVLRNVFNRWLKEALKGAPCPMSVGLNGTMEAAINKVAKAKKGDRARLASEARAVFDSEIKRLSTPAAG